MRTDALAHGGGALFALHAAHKESGAARAWGEAEPPGGDAEAQEAPPEGGWLRVRPYGVPTERDKVCEAKWRPVFRTLLVRTDAPAPHDDAQAAPPREPAPSDA